MDSPLEKCKQICMFNLYYADGQYPDSRAESQHPWLISAANIDPSEQRQISNMVEFEFFIPDSLNPFNFGMKTWGLPSPIQSKKDF